MSSPTSVVWITMSKIYQEIVAIILTTSGWILVTSTLPTDYWKVYSLDGTVLATATYWSNLWKTCVTDLTGVSDCKDFPSMLALDGHIHLCRGLMITSVCLGFFGTLFALVGMECTKIGGTDRINSAITCSAGVDFILSGLCSLSAFSLYAHQITSEFFDPMFFGQKYELGAALYIGWGGSVLCIIGGSILCFSIADSFAKSHTQVNNTYKGATTHSHISSYPRRQANSVKRFAISTKMGYRTVVMYMEIGCFITCVTGWILVCSTMPTEIWTWSEVDSIVLTTSNYFSNLWKDCISDSTGVSDCKGIPSMLALNWDIHMCRALIIISIILAFFGSVLVLVGMKCTKIGGSEISNARVTFAGGMNYFIGGMCSMVAFSYYGNKIRSEFDDPHYKAQKFEIGVGVFVGWGGSTLLVVGGLIYSIFAGREGCHSSSKRYPAYGYPDAYTVVPTRKGPASLAGTKRSQSRKSRNTSESGDSSFSGVTSITKTTASNSSGVTSITKTTASNEYV